MTGRRESTPGALGKAGRRGRKAACGLKVVESALPFLKVNATLTHVAWSAVRTTGCAVPIIG